ncbi:MAG: hypothetical protein VB084_12915 [Syntrophomonadaceae bacterium]|nr:hypothetical protein [Syntrophomonadaceae bacterium]
MPYTKSGYQAVNSAPFKDKQMKYVANQMKWGFILQIREHFLISVKMHGAGGL